MIFFVLIKRKIFRQKNYYLLAELVEEMANFLIKKLSRQFTVNIKSQNTRKFNNVHSKEVRPVNYAMTSIAEAGLRDKQITLAFEKMMKP